MSTPLWVRELAAAFWALAGDEPFPRELRKPITRALPLSVVTIPQLSVSTIDGWLERRGVICALGVTDRSLRACLVAEAGHGFIFLDASDPSDEQRFSLAHELAHFLRDYWWPRRRAAERFGAEILEVFDGRRRPLPHERLHSMLALVPVGRHIHLMERNPRDFLDEAVLRSERDADRLAYELLAPEDVVIRSSSFVVRGATHNYHHLTTLLASTYGLPQHAAEQCATVVSGSHHPSPLMRHLRSVL